jgi:type I restriction enzyme R subunit
MRLLIVVDKLLTGFDAPPCTYLYIDKSMQDHGLFQAICRTNRLDGEDKDFGHIVDYKDLFKKLVNDKGTGALQVYSSELDRSAGGTDPDVLLQSRLEKGRERLDTALEQMEAMCDPVEPPQRELEYIHYFCGNPEIATDLKAREPRRVALYTAVVSLVRASANLADDMAGAGYSAADAARVTAKIEWAVRLRDTIRNASGETLDLKPYEADMRHLIDTYVEASAPRKISPFDEMGLLELIAKTGMDKAIDSLPDGIKSNKDAIAEAIENNVRSKIVKEHLNDPAFYAKMSELLAEVIRFRKAHADRYAEYLKRLGELAKQVQAGHTDDLPEALKRSAGLRALYNNVASPGHGVGDLETEAGRAARLHIAQAIDATVRRVRPAHWRGHQARENIIKQALLPLLDGNAAEVERIFQIITQQPEY